MLTYIGHNSWYIENDLYNILSQVYISLISTYLTLYTKKKQWTIKINATMYIKWTLIYV